MMSIFSLFSDYPFLLRSLQVLILVSISAAPLGFFLHLRRMSLIGDALSHSILPGAALGYLIGGLSLTSLFLGGLTAGLCIAVLSGLASHWSSQKEDSSFAAFYLIALALGVLMLSSRGSEADLVHLLFGSVFLVDDQSLFLAMASTLVIVVALVIFRRPLLIEGFDPSLLPRFGYNPLVVHLGFLSLVVLGLLSAFQTLGTLLALGLMVLPAAAARMWTNKIHTGIALSLVFSIIASVSGLILSVHLDCACGPCVILVCGGLYILSLLFSPRTGLITIFKKGQHFEQ
jgi:zinc/manganese transport system permease protein